MTDPSRILEDAKKDMDWCSASWESLTKCYVGRQLSTQEIVYVCVLLGIEPGPHTCQANTASLSYTPTPSEILLKSGFTIPFLPSG
jgi:hypothetical protein